jgi:hypothetical protein
MPSVFMEDFAWRIPLVDRIEKSDRLTRLLVNELKQRLFAMDSNPLTPGMVLRLPTYVSSRQNANTTTPMGEILNAIKPSYMPYFEWAQAHKKKHWWQIFIRVFIEIIDKVVGVVAMEWAGPVAAAPAEALVDAGLQGIFYGVHLLDNFSWEVPSR